MNKFLITIALVFLFAEFSFSQVEATTADGKKVILNADGTWKYIEASISSAEQLEAICEYRINQTDPSTGTIKKFTKLETIGKDKTETFKVSLRVEKGKKYMVAIYTGNLGCITKESTIMIRLLNGEVIRINNSGDNGCNAGETMIYELGFEDVNKLSNSPFLRIRVTGSDFFADLAPMNPNYFVDKLKCLD